MKELIELTRELADRELAPRAAAAEEQGEFPRDVFRLLGHAGLLGLPYPEEHGGGGQPYSVYLTVLEELAQRWLSVGLGISVHTLACYPLATFGSTDQKRQWLPEMIGGELLGAYCLSEPQSGSDAAALTTTAELIDDRYLINGRKAWVTHGGVADFYALFARTATRTADNATSGIGCFLVQAGAVGWEPLPPERKMGLNASPTAQLAATNVQLPADRRIGAPDEGFRIAMSALDSGRLGIAACAVGLSQAAFDYALAYVKTRRQFGRSVGEFQGVGFLLADAATAIAAARELYQAAARKRDAGENFSTVAAQAKLFATDVAMRVTTDAVQLLGGAGYVADHPTERWLREAKVLQIVEGTNQIQRLVIARALMR